MLILFIVHLRAKRSGALDGYKTSLQILGSRGLFVELFWQLDVVGIILVIAMLALILVPFTIAGGLGAQWKTAKVLAPLVVGILIVPVWVWWEQKCEHPMIPFKVGITL